MYLISYDITENRTRNKIAKELENYGKRVQYSVFECDITAKQLEKLQKNLLTILDAEEGNIRFYTLCARCEAKIQVFGTGEGVLHPEEEALFIV